MTRAAVFLLSLLGPVLAGAPSSAQTTGPVPTPPAETAPAAGAITPPALASERARRLDELYARLR